MRLASAGNELQYDTTKDCLRSSLAVLADIADARAERYLERLVRIPLQGIPQTSQFDAVVLG